MWTKTLEKISEKINKFINKSIEKQTISMTCAIIFNNKIWVNIESREQATNHFKNEIKNTKNKVKSEIIDELLNNVDILSQQHGWMFSVFWLFDLDFLLQFVVVVVVVWFAIAMKTIIFISFEARERKQRKSALGKWRG